MNWFEDLGFDDNPFSPSLEASARAAVGLDKPIRDVEYFISAGSLIFVEGARGTGKSVFLKKLSDRLGRRAVTVDGEAGAVGIRKAVRQKTSILARVFGDGPKNVVLLVDNANGLSKDAMELIKYNFDNNHFSAVVLAGTSLKHAGLSASILDRIGTRIITLPAITEEEAVLIARNRLGFSDIITDDTLRKLYKKSDKNPKAFLHMCEAACASAVAAKATTGTEQRKKKLVTTND